MSASFKSLIIKTIIPAAILIYLVCFYLLSLYITDYKPTEIEKISPELINTDFFIQNDEISILSWNISHASFGKEKDSGFEDTYQTRPSLETYQKNLNTILRTISDYDFSDFILLQDVDVFSKRSYFINQKNLIAEYLPDFSLSFSKNQDVQFIISPLYNPIGRIKSGLLTLSKVNPFESSRIAIKSINCFPKKLWTPDPCFMLNRYPLENGKNLIIINIQNFINADAMYNIENAKKLIHIAVNEFNKGNFVIIGGDWNINPTELKSNNRKSVYKTYDQKNNITGDFFPEDWACIYDTLKPTKSEKLKNYNIVISDYFVISPNINVQNIRKIDLDFENLSHNPVLLQISLKRD